MPPFTCLVTNSQCKFHLSNSFDYSPWRLLGLRDMALAMMRCLCLEICSFCRYYAFSFCFLVCASWFFPPHSPDGLYIIWYHSCAAGLMRMLLVHVHSLSLHLSMNLLLMMRHCYPQASVLYPWTIKWLVHSIKLVNLGILFLGLVTFLTGYSL